MLCGFRSTSANGTGSISLDYETMERMKSCVHEAAHAVASRKNGFPVKWISIDPDFIQNDPLAIEKEISTGHPVCMTIASHVLLPILRKGNIIYKSDKDAVFEYGVQIMAGPLAEFRIDPETYDPAAAGGDINQISHVLAMAIPAISARKNFYRVIRRAANKLVISCWPQIIHLAGQLDARLTIHEGEIDTVIAEGQMATNMPH